MGGATSLDALLSHAINFLLPCELWPLRDVDEDSVLCFSDSSEHLKTPLGQSRANESICEVRVCQGTGQIWIENELWSLAQDEHCQCR